MGDFGQVVSGFNKTVGDTADNVANQLGVMGGRRRPRKSGVKRRPVRRGGNQVEDFFNQQQNAGARRRSRRPRKTSRKVRGGNENENFESMDVLGGRKRRSRSPRSRPRRRVRGGEGSDAPATAPPVKEGMTAAKKVGDKFTQEERFAVENFALFGGRAMYRKPKKMSGDSKIKKMLKVEKMAKAKVVKAMKVATKAAKVARGARISINKMRSKSK